MIPFTLLGPWFAAVTVTLNGADYTLFVDTGGGTTRFVPALKDEVGLSAIAEGRAHDAFREHAIETAVVSSFLIGGHEIQDLPVMLLDEPHVSEGHSERVVGFLGHDVLDRFCTTFDLNAGYMMLEPPGTLRGGPNVECLCDGAGWFVHARCGEHGIRLQLDTGAGISCLRPNSPVASSLTIIPDIVVRTAAPTGTQDCPVGTMSELTVGGLALPGVEFALGEFYLDDAAGDFVDGLLGIDALGPLRWTVDHDAQAASFAPSTDAAN